MLQGMRKAPYLAEKEDEVEQFRFIKVNPATGKASYDRGTEAEAATGVFTLTGSVSEDEKVEIGDEEYIFDEGTASAPAGVIKVDVSEDTSDSGAATALADAINANSELVTAEADAEEVTVTYVSVGTEGNDVTTTDTVTNGSWGEETLTGGSDSDADANAVSVSNMEAEYNNCVSYLPVGYDEKEVLIKLGGTVSKGDALESLSDGTAIKSEGAELAQACEDGVEGDLIVARLTVL